MKITETKLKGLFQIEPSVFGDERGYFLEGYHSEKFKEAGIKEDFVQLNQSFSQKGVVRGLHFQTGTHAQGKLVRCLTGKVLDVVVDIRKDSSTFGHSFSEVLDSKRHNMLYVPPGFAHGFSTLEDSTFLYLCTSLYNKETEGGVIWNDADLNIDWQVQNPIVSEKDQLLPKLKDLNV